MHTRIGLLLAFALSVGAAWADTEYVVKPGDTLGDICRAHGVDLAEVVRLNQIEDADLIFPGELLVLPDGKEEGQSANGALPPPQAPSAHDRLSTSATLPFKTYGSVGSNLRAVSRVKIAEEVLDKLNQAPPTSIGGFQMAAQLGEIALRAPMEDRAMVVGMLSLITVPYASTLAGTLGTMPTFAMDAVFPAAKTAIGQVIKQTLTSYGRNGVNQVVNAATNAATQAAVGAATTALGQ